MGKAACKSKITYFSREEGEALALPGTDIYLCHRCNNFHSASKQSSRKNKEQYAKYKRRK